MRFVSLCLALTLAACASTSSSSPYPAAQAVVDAVAARHADCTRLTVHAAPQGRTTLVQVASTMPERRGKPSDPEDQTAMRTGEMVVLDEPGAIDVTVPILVEAGSPGAIAGVTLKAPAGADRAGLISSARAIAGELEREIRASGKPLW